MKIAFPKPARAHNPSCKCAACAGKSAGLYPHWRERRYRRIGTDGRHRGCACSHCRARQAVAQAEYEGGGAHVYWRERRQQRDGRTPGLDQENVVFLPNNFSNTPNPVRSFFGQSPKQIRRRKPSGWRTMRADTGLGWKMIDDKGNERIRFMRPNPRKKGTGQSWAHIATGYWVIRDGQGNYLDGDGNIVAPNIPFRNMTEDQKRRIHVQFTGNMNELHELDIF
jgi:hypothetical protein